MNMFKLAVVAILLLLMTALILLSVPTLDRECVRDVIILPAFIVALSLLFKRIKK